jgi:hypothetical protein
LHVPTPERGNDPPRPAILKKHPAAVRCIGPARKNLWPLRKGPPAGSLYSLALGRDRLTLHPSASQKKNRAVGLMHSLKSAYFFFCQYFSDSTVKCLISRTLGQVTAGHPVTDQQLDCPGQIPAPETLPPRPANPWPLPGDRWPVFVRAGSCAKG